MFNTKFTKSTILIFTVEMNKNTYRINEHLFKVYL